MENLTFTLQVITVDFFLAYGLYSLLYLACRIFITNPILEKIDVESTKLISLIGIVYGVLWLIGLGIILTSSAEQDLYDVKNRIFGKYWFGYWIQPFLWILITQLLRFIKIRRNILSRLTAAFFLMLSIERIIIIITSLHRDYLPSSWTMYSDAGIYPSNFFLGMLMKVFLFLFFVASYYYLKIFSKKNKILNN
ncbi:hypothetical protein [Flavobacterium silvaticum]|uniref:Uncharacterized protein n=1 Tax=Flavobacterium silvaticum TaxID=1852020 RepID=A0A972JGR1_9FLAO|nr:hypothetical protein [Flavobacterium silvaticum]NMH29309.1 hypothetical protein [Flavobacterium silvaticum]